MIDLTPQPILEALPDIGIREVDFKRPSVAARSASNQTPIPLPALLGPLTAFVGSWTGTGFNTIFRPNSQKTPTFPAPLNTSDNVLELNLTREVLSFSPNLNAIPNRGSDQQADVFLNGVPYVQSIQDVTSDPPNAIHFEPGIWLHVPATEAPALPVTLARMASIPHGTTITAQGVVLAAVNGPPQIGPVGITPFPPGNPKQKVPFPSQTAANGTTPRLPQNLTPFIVAGTISQAILDDPNIVLRNQIAHQKIIKTVVIGVSTQPATPLEDGPFPAGAGDSPPPPIHPKFGGGQANIAFLQGLPTPPPSGVGPNALANQMDAIFWIETVEYEIDVPPLETGLPAVIIILPSADPATQRPAFSVSLPFENGKRFAGGKIKMTAPQIQYTQKVILQFAGLNWPHVSVATLLPTDPIPIPPELLPLT